MRQPALRGMDVKDGNANERGVQRIGRQGDTRGSFGVQQSQACRGQRVEAVEVGRGFQIKPITKKSRRNCAPRRRED